MAQVAKQPPQQVPSFPGQWGQGTQKLLGVMDLSCNLFVEVVITDYMHLSNFTEVYTKKGQFYCT